MGRNRRKRQKKKQKGKRRAVAETATPVSWKWYAAVIVAASILFAVFIVTQFDPIDQVTMAGFSVICVGLALLIIGTCKGVGNYEFHEDSWIGKGLNYLAILATPKRRFGELFYSRSAIYVIFERLLIAIVIPLGVLLVFLQPKQTWPAVIWVMSGLLAVSAGWLICASQSIGFH